MLKQLSALAIAASLMATPAFAQNASQIAKAKSGKSCAGCNLFQADFSYTDAAGMDFSKSRLRQANLALTTFDDVNFSKSNLSVANLFGARFNRCDLSQADLTNASAVGAYFGSSNLKGAKLAGTNVSGADLSVARGLTQKQLDQACGDRATKLPKGLRIPACR